MVFTSCVTFVVEISFLNNVAINEGELREQYTKIGHGHSVKIFHTIHDHNDICVFSDMLPRAVL